MLVALFNSLNKLNLSDCASHFDDVMLLRHEINAAVDKAIKLKIIKHIREAHVCATYDNYFSCATMRLPPFPRHHPDAPESIFGCAEIEWIHGDDDRLNSADWVRYESKNYVGLTVLVRKSDFDKCERCWVHHESVGRCLQSHQTLCYHCAETIGLCGIKYKWSDA